MRPLKNDYKYCKWKGGTGKTTVATNLAMAIGSDVQLLDCDVEEPNSHLFINPVFEKTITVTTPVPEVDKKNATSVENATKYVNSKL